jgi:hypothetical protein
MIDAEPDAPKPRKLVRTKAYRQPPLWIVLTEAILRIDELEADYAPVRIEARR